MQDFLNDVNDQLSEYYDQLVYVFPRILLAIAFLVIFWMAVSLVIKYVRPILKEQLDDQLLARFIVRALKLTFFLIGLLIALHMMGLSGAAGALLGTAGVGAFVIGFALKDIFEHFLAGLVLAFNRPFRVGDTVELDGVKGKVLSLNMRNTHIKTFDGQDVYIPNGNIIKNALKNFTIDGFYRYDFTVGLDYGSDVTRAIQIVQEELKKIQDILQGDKAPTVVVGQLGESALELNIFFWLHTLDPEVSAGAVRTQAVDHVLTALSDAGFYLPGTIIELTKKGGGTVGI